MLRMHYFAGKQSTMQPKHSHLLLLLLALALSACQSGTKEKNASQMAPPIIRVATYNSSLFQREEGELLARIIKDSLPNAATVAEIIALNAPDVIALQEFDYGEGNAALALLIEKYGLDYRYYRAFPSNTGIPTGLDLNGDGKTATANDAYGYGQFPGQYGFALLSKYPILEDSIRTFQHFLWKDMPGALWPRNADSTQYYSEEAREIFRLSSKNHVDVPVETPIGIVHMLISHPTPPVFDGPEDRNGTRNHDEIRLFADYISGGEQAAYLYDDAGQRGGLHPDARFVVLGDQNADPVDGDTWPGAIQQLLDNRRVHAATAMGELVPASQGSVDNHNAKPKGKGNPAHDTADWGNRADYVLPSANLVPLASGVHWSPAADSLSAPEYRKGASDHKLVWVDISLPKQ